MSPDEASSWIKELRQNPAQACLKWVIGHSAKILTTLAISAAIIGVSTKTYRSLFQEPKTENSVDGEPSKFRKPDLDNSLVNIYPDNKKPEIVEID